MTTLAFLHPLPDPLLRCFLEDTLGAPWVNNIDWIDCGSPPDRPRILHIVEERKPQVVLAMGAEATAALPQVKGAALHPFKLFRTRYPRKGRHNAISSMTGLRTLLDMELSMREGTGAEK